MDNEQFKNGLESDIELNIAKCTTDTNLVTYHLQNAIRKQLNIWAPLKTIQMKTNHQPYISE